MYARLER